MLRWIYQDPSGPTPDKRANNKDDGDDDAGGDEEESKDEKDDEPEEEEEEEEDEEEMVDPKDKFEEGKFSLFLSQNYALGGLTSGASRDTWKRPVANHMIM
jgi:hypothetical protein